MISDGSARATALDPQRSFIVQAPAGSGKTGLLVYRMLRLLATVEQPQQILAITFTRKATAEMRERILELLSLADEGETSNDAFEQQGIELAKQVIVRDEQLAWNLLDTPHQLQILTIDAFCAKLTTSMPWLSRLGDRPRATDNAQVHYAAAVEQLLAELLDDESPISPSLQTVLLELDYNYNTARKLFSSMLAKRDQWLRHLLNHDLANLRDSLEASWSEIVSGQLASLQQNIGDVTITQLCELANGAAHVLFAKDPKKPSPLFAFLEYEPSQRRLSLEQWKALVFLLVAPSSGSFRKTANIGLGFAPKTAEKESLISLLTELADEGDLLFALNSAKSLPTIHYQDSDWQQLLALEQVLKALAAFLQLRFRAVGECDHSEVTQRANLALQELDNPTDLGLRMDYTLHHILVDEFQDTSTGQVSLIKKLTSAWSAQDTPAKTLFLVGDPMQSIYRFREANVSLFLQVVDNQDTGIFDNLEIESLQLSENFRSSSTLVDWFNTTFAKSFPKQDDVLSGAIEYSPASSSKAENLNCLEYYLAEDKEGEAKLLVSALQKALLNLPDDRSQVAVLVRSRPQLNYMLPALDQAGINYLGVDIQPLRSQQAVIDVVALCKAICRQDDRVSWLALLRGPWCGLSLSEMKCLLSSTERTVWQQLNTANVSDLAPDSQHRLKRFLDTMNLARQQRQQVDLGALTRWAWNALGGPHTLFGAAPDDIDIVFELIDSLQKGGDLSSISDLENALDGLYAKPSKEASQNARVVVSTMHKAKGLQYHTVILPGLANAGRAEEKSILMWAEQQNQHGEANLLLAPLRLDPADDDHYSYLRMLDAHRARNELIRVMYVAATRAEKKLILLGQTKPDTKTEEPRRPKSGSLLATVWESLEGQFSFNTIDQIDAEQAGLSQTLSRLPVGFVATQGESINWQVEQQLSVPSPEEDPIESGIEPDIEFEWATAVATAVGIVLHEWLEHIGARVLTTAVDRSLQMRWRAELIALRVPNNRVEYGLKRLVKAVQNIQSDSEVHFLFDDYAIQQNEYALTAFEEGAVNQYRIDRTFVDESGTRWILDYKSTDTRNQNVEQFIDEQLTTRHMGQLQKYAQLMSQIDSRPIKLAVYFPLLNTLRAWDYQPNN